jgi:CheY-like chemotaxis protein
MPRVLVVEDNDELREMLYQALFEAGFDVITASSVAEAKDLLTYDHRPCVVVLDLRLGEVRGEELLEWMRSHPRGRSTSTIVITADPKARDVPGQTALLRKPLDVDRLVGAIALHYGRLLN